MNQNIWMAPFQAKRIRKTFDADLPWALAYSTSEGGGEFEILECINKERHYALAFASESQAQTYASWFKGEAFINLRPVNLTLFGIENE